MMPSQFPFSRRTNWELSSNRLISLLEELKSKNISIFDLTESNPTRCQIDYPEEAILKALNTPANLKYTPDSKGLLTARQAVSNFYGSTRFACSPLDKASNHPERMTSQARSESKGYIDPEKIILTSSTSEAYAFCFRLLANPEDKILIPAPSYPLFQYLIGLNDAEMGFYPLVFKEDGWYVDLKSLEKQMDHQTRVLVLVNPNNPTGSYIKKGELEAINALCKKFKTAILCDEVFFNYCFQNENKEIMSLINNNEVLTFVLGGLSKSLGLPQMKLSWIIPSGPKSQVIEALSRLEIIADTFLSVNTPVQNALTQWLDNYKVIHGIILDRVCQNYQWIQKRLFGQKNIHALGSEGGWYVVIQIPTTMTEEDWCLSFLEKDHVFVHPGYFFDFPQEAFIVLSLLPTPQVFQEGVERLIKRIT